MSHWTRDPYHPVSLCWMIGEQLALDRSADSFAIRYEGLARWLPERTTGRPDFNEAYCVRRLRRGLRKAGEDGYALTLGPPGIGCTIKYLDDETMQATVQFRRKPA